MVYLVKNEQNEIMKLTVVSGHPQLPEGFELIGLESEVNPDALDVSNCEWQEVVIQAEEQVLRRAAQEAQDEILAQDAILDKDGNVIAPAVAHQDAVAARPALYLTVPEIKKWMLVESATKLRAKKLKIIRSRRDALMNDADITVNKAVDSGKGLAAAKVYRQSLRDITDAFVADMSLLDAIDAETFEFPVKP